MNTTPPTFPPYGLMHDGLLLAIAEYPQPVGWRDPAGGDPAVAWPAAYRALVDRLAAAFWPRWAPSATGAPGWDGPAATQMHALTRADFALLPGLQAQLPLAVQQQAPGGAPLASQQPHVQFFEVEDFGDSPLPVMDYLDFGERTAVEKALAATRLPALPDLVMELAYKHATAATLPSKRELQRPRPYQMASLYGTPFSYHFAASAVTSALPSGHAIQGVMGVCAAWLALQRARPSALTAELTSKLRQYAVDMGDRRVFAGVHYPSDNLASWCIALTLGDALYGSQAGEGRDFLVRAVREHSLVYRALRAAGDPAFAPGLAWFDELAGPTTPKGTKGAKTQARRKAGKTRQTPKTGPAEGAGKDR